MKRNLRMLSFFMALLMVCLCIPVVALDSFATGDSITQTEHDGTDAVSNDTNLDGTQVEDMLLEDVSKRDAFTKHYDLGNGSYYAVVFPEQVHYFENDQWVEIDNSLQYNSASGRYESANQIFSTGFAPNATAGDAVSVTNGDYTVSWSLIFEGGNNHLQSEEQGPILAQPIQITNGQAFEMNAWELDSGTGTIGKAASSVTYADLQNGSVDVRYSVYHGKVKEDVILESADALTSYALVMDTDGLIAIQNDDNSVSFVDAQGEVFFTMGAPWMQDSDAGVSHDVAVEVMQKGNQAIIAYTPDAEWLQAEERVYPVLIDPSFTANYYTCNIVDTYVYTGDSASATRANESILRVGYVNSKTYAAYMKFENLPDFSSYAVITDAQLDFYVNTTSSPELSVYEADGAWDPATITYANQPLEGNMLVYSTSGYATGYVSKYSLDLGSLIDYAHYERGDVAAYLINDWDGLKIIYEGGNEDTSIFSAQYTTNMDYRPTLRLTYTYYPGTEIANGAVYSFKNAANGEYMTVNSSGNYASAGLASKSTTLFKQSFRLAWDSSVGAYNIHALTTSGQSASYVLSGDSDIVYSDYAEDLYLYQKQTSRAEDQGWVIDHVQNGLYRIINAAHPELAVTGCTNDDYYDLTMGIAYEGNVCIMPYTGATNQLWRLESGGSQVGLGYNIRNTTELTVKEQATYVSFYCLVDDLESTVSNWRSDNSDVASVTQAGIVTVNLAGRATISVDVTNSDDETTTYQAIVYVKLEDGVYYINNVANSNYRIEYESLNSVGEGESLLLRNSGTEEATSRKALFKIRYIGEGKYSIRSMLDSSMGWVHEGYQTSSATVGYTDADIDDNEKWVITSDELGYYIYGYMVGRVIAAPATITDGVELTSATKLSNTSQRWTLTKKSASYSEHGVYMTRKTNRLIVGQSFSFDAVFYTSNTAYNGGNTITWQKVNETGGASFDSGTRTLTATSAGTVKLTATYTKSATQQWSISRTVTIDEIFPEGVYLIENAQYGTYLQECGDGSDAVVELAEFTGSEAQLWYISSYEDGTCEIKKDVQGKVLTGYYTDNSFSHWQFRDSVGADIAMWYVVPVDDDTYQIASKANSARQIMVDTTSGDVILDTFSRDVGNEWIFHPMSENVVNLEVVYDQAYASRYSNAIDRINEQMISLREIYFFRFGIWINYSEPSVFTSYADRCNSMYTAPCTHSINCTDSNLAYVDSLHHKNITNILHHIGYPDKSITLKLAYTGHFTCSNRSGEHRYNGVRGLAYMDYGIAIVTADDTQNAEQRTAVHEFGHLYGVLDHYNQGDAPSTSDMNNEVEGAPFSSYCIYGENRSDINVTNNLSICDGCRSAIESNKNEYDH